MAHEIHKWIEEDFYEDTVGKPGWKNLVSAHLSSNKKFIREQRVGRQGGVWVLRELIPKQTKVRRVAVEPIAPSPLPPSQLQAQDPFARYEPTPINTSPDFEEGLSNDDDGGSDEDDGEYTEKSKDKRKRR
jgi:hypothetical protein